MAVVNLFTFLMIFLLFCTFAEVKNVQFYDFRTVLQLKKEALLLQEQKENSVEAHSPVIS